MTPHVLHPPLVMGRKYWVNSVPLLISYDHLVWSSILDQLCREMLESRTLPDGSRHVVFNYGWVQYSHRVYSAEAFYFKPVDPVTGETCQLAVMWESINSRTDYIGVVRTSSGSARSHFTPIAVCSTNDSGAIVGIGVETSASSAHYKCLAVQYERTQFYIDPTTWEVVDITEERM